MSRSRGTRIVVNALSAKLGGGKTYLRNLLTRIPKEADVEIRIFCPEDIPLPNDKRLRRERTKWPTSNPVLRSIWEKVLLPRFLTAINADILFCPGGVVATRVPKGVRVVTMFRNMIPFDEKLVADMPWGLMYLRNIILRSVMLQSMSKADLTIFISNHARSLIEKLVRIPNPVTIPHGVNDQFCQKSSKPLRPSAAPDGPYILYVSRFDVYKHHDNVVRGFASLPQHIRKNHKLVLLGETDLPPFNAVSDLIASQGLGGEVVIGGAVPYESLPGWYAHADVILFASSCENCPNILLESLGAGRPVLCSDVLPMPEFGGPELCYFSPFDHTSIASAMRSVLESPDRSKTIADAAFRRSQLYDWDITARRTWESILKLMERQP